MNKKESDKVVNALEGSRKLKCPFCKYNFFVRTEKALIQINEDDGLRDEHINNIDYSFKCDKCGKDVNDEELI